MRCQYSMTMSPPTLPQPQTNSQLKRNFILKSFAPKKTTPFSLNLGPSCYFQGSWNTSFWDNIKLKKQKCDEQSSKAWISAMGRCQQLYYKLLNPKENLFYKLSKSLINTFEMWWLIYNHICFHNITFTSHKNPSCLNIALMLYENQEYPL